MIACIVQIRKAAAGANRHCILVAFEGGVIADVSAIGNWLEVSVTLAGAVGNTPELTPTFGGVALSCATTKY